MPSTLLPSYDSMLRTVRRLTLNIGRRTSSYLAPAALAVVVLIAAWPLLGAEGLLNTRGGGDSPFLLQRVQQMVVALQDGHFPVRWMPDAAYGYGYPFFNYYAPFSIYVAAFFRFLGYSYVHAIQLAQLLAFFVAAWATFRLARRWFQNEWAALLAAAAYTLAPFHLVNVYVRGDSLAEFWAMALYPLVLLAADGVLRSARPAPQGETRPAWRRGAAIGALGLSYGALVLCHNISALIFSPFVLLYVLLLGWSDVANSRRALLFGASGLLLGLALSAWFWLPALTETDLVQTGPVTQGYFHYSNHFRGVDLVQGSLLFDYDVARGGAFRMGLLQALLAVAGAGVLAWRLARSDDQSRLWRLRIVFVLLTLLVATLMVTPLSTVLWERLPLLPYVQFPWRFLSVQALGAALVTGALGLLPGRRPLALAGVALFLLAIAPGLPADYLVLGDGDVTSERLAQYEWFTGNVGSTVRAEYLPATVQPRPFTGPWLNDGQRHRAQVLEGQAQARLTERHATRQTWAVEVQSDTATVEFPTLFWPGWRATIDGEAVPLGPAGNSGLAALQVPAGAHDVVLRLGRTPVRLAAEIVSLVGALLTVGLVAPLWIHDLGRARTMGRGMYLLIGLIIIFLLVWRFWPRPALNPDTLTWDFAQMGYLSHAPDGVRFSDGSVLTGYEYEREVVSPGQTLRIVTEWRGAGAGDGAQGIVTLHTPAVHRFAQAPALQEDAQSLASGRVVFELPIPAEAPAGLYVPRLERVGATGLTTSGQARGPLFLRPLRVLSAPAPANAGVPLRVRAVDVLLEGDAPAVGEEATGIYDCASAEPSDAQLNLHLAWLTDRPLADNYAASLRLTGAGGRSLVQCDVQPGYGFRPSGGWTPGVWTHDLLALPLPEQLPPAESYVLLVTLYDRPGQPVLTRRLGQVAWEQGGAALAFRRTEPVYELPSGLPEMAVRFGDVALLRGVEQAREGDSLTLTLYWEALQPLAQDYVRFVHLVGEASPQPLAQVDSMPRNNSYPTSQWSEGEIIADSVTLDLSEVEDGSYRLAVGFYPPADPLSRLPVMDAQGDLQPDGRYLLTEMVEVN